MAKNNFNVFIDQENTFLPTKLKENNQKRSALSVVNRNQNVKDFNEVKTKQTTAFQIYEEVKEKINTKTNQSHKLKKPLAEVPTKQTFKIFEEIRIEEKFLKAENKPKALRDRTVVDDAKPSCSEDIAACITALPSEWTSQSSSLLEDPMSEADDLFKDLPMSIEKSEKKEKREITQHMLNEQLFTIKEYHDDIMRYLRKLELERKASKHYMQKQNDISYAMRAILVDWVVEVVEEYKMSSETLFLSISYIDRFLSCMSVVRAKLQLVGTAAMFIASKFEEIYPPDVKDFVYITDDTYTKSQVLKTEMLILKVLAFDLSTPTPLVFLNSYITKWPVEEKIKYLAMYLMELTLLEGEPYIGMLPSEIAGSALIIARYTLLDFTETEDLYCDQLLEVIDYDIEDLVACIQAMDNTFKNAEKSPQQAIRDKYMTDKYLKVAAEQPLNEDCHTVILKSINSNH